MSFAEGIVTTLRRLVSGVLGAARTTSARTLLRDSRGRLVAVGERERREAGQLTGQGRKMSTPLQLGKGSYRIEYQFQVHTQLLMVDDEGEEILTAGVGAGTVRMGIPQAGTYRLLVEPISESGTWTVIYRPID